MENSILNNQSEEIINSLINKSKLINKIANYMAYFFVFSFFSLLFLGFINLNIIIVFLSFLPLIMTGIMSNTDLIEKIIEKLILKKAEYNFIKSIDAEGISIYKEVKKHLIIFLLKKILKKGSLEDVIILFEIDNYIKDNETNKLFYEIIKKYYKINLIKLIYSTNNKTHEEIVLIEFLNKNEKIKELIISDSKYILKNQEIKEIFEYNQNLNKIPTKDLLKKVLEKLTLKELVKLAFNKTNIYTEDSSVHISLWNFLNGPDIKNVLLFKKEIVINVLESENEENIYGSEINFIEFAEQIEVNKDSLLLIKTKLNKKNIVKELKILNI